MAYINIPPSLYTFFDTINNRLLKLETANRFTAPVVPALGSTPTITGLATGDPTNPRAGDIWLNSTSNTPKYVDATGAVTNLTAPVAAPYGPRYIKAGFFYAPIGLTTQGTAANFPANTLYAVPFYCSTSITAIYLSINVSALNGASGGIRIGLYSNSTNDDYPNALLADSGVIGTDTVNGATGPNLAIISVALTAGIYWLVAVRQGASNPSIYSYTNTNGSVNQVIPTGTLSSSSYGAVAWSQAAVSGALPATFSTTKVLELQAPAVIIGF